jgi:hypothetical protein
MSIIQYPNVSAATSLAVARRELDVIIDTLRRLHNETSIADRCHLDLALEALGRTRSDLSDRDQDGNKGVTAGPRAA